MGIKILLFFQEISSPILDKIFIFITNLGSEIFYLMFIAYIYWCVNKRFGIKLFSILALSIYSNNLLKVVFHTSRPFLYSEIQTPYIQSAIGYSFPSGHTQGAATFWYYIMKKARKKSVYIIGWTIIILVGISRLYLRVHWPIDVIGGLVFGILIVWLFQSILDYLRKCDSRLINIGLIIMLVLMHFLAVTESNIKILSLFSGSLLGSFLEFKYINFNEYNSFLKQIAKYLIGLLSIFLIRSLLFLILPVNIYFVYLKHFIFGICLTLIVPLLFIILGLTKRKG
ncbi:phosphatase PAP2 family protein [Caloranaerobacter azorensis]|uniref:Phosphatase PAP2 family protein n=1 Tax=Caloranaerobacter azorensis TaxID=116090 RepID=A0A6P1YBP1_9FIRM|nr:phosphatase PAP2 family protein [Caloranaerobacter azorensis]QIB26268.1 phosphatase PAP2 family protein [Caloranaerobacter azorensis]